MEWVTLDTIGTYEIIITASKRFSNIKPPPIHTYYYTKRELRKLKRKAKKRPVYVPPEPLVFKKHLEVIPYDEAKMAQLIEKLKREALEGNNISYEMLISIDNEQVVSYVLEAWQPDIEAANERIIHFCISLFSNFRNNEKVYDFLCEMAVIDHKRFLTDSSATSIEKAKNIADRIRSNAIWELVFHRDKKEEVLSFILSKKDDPNPVVRKEIMQMLVFLDKDALINILMEYTKDEDESVRKDAIERLEYRKIKYE